MMKKLFIIFGLILIAVLAQAQNSGWPYIYRTPGVSDTLLIWHNDSTKVTTVGEFSFLLRGDSATYFLYSEYGDNYLNGDLDVHGRITEHPYYDIDLDDYFEADPNKYVYGYRGGVANIDGNASGIGYVNAKYDTLNITNLTRPFAYEYIENNISTRDATRVVSIEEKVIKVNEYFSSNGIRPYGESVLLYPEAGDTISASDVKSKSIQLQTYTPEADSRIDINEGNVLNLYAAIDNEVAIDSLTMLEIQARATGVDPDSIQKYFAIKHTIHDNDALFGADNTYFLYSEYGDNYLNGDLEVTGEINPFPDTIDMDDYYSADYSTSGGSVFHNSGRSSYINPNTVPAHNWMEIVSDTFYLNNFSRGWRGKREERHVDGVMTLGPALVTGATTWLYLHDFESVTDVDGAIFGTLLNPLDNDTIIADEVSGLKAQIRAYDPGTNSRIDLGAITVLDVYTTTEPEMAVDSIMMVEIRPNDNGMPVDSITAYYGIYHGNNSVSDEIHGDDRTYFLYSEYGDNYLNGDLEVTGSVKQTQLTGSLTDGTPTDAEIDTVTGTTPSAVGAGWQVTIKDNDGSGLLYRVESDGTYWFYTVMAQAS